jgi:hypothetical protein
MQLWPSACLLQGCGAAFCTFYSFSPSSFPIQPRDRHSSATDCLQAQATATAMLVQHVAALRVPPLAIGMSIALSIDSPHVTRLSSTTSLLVIVSTILRRTTECTHAARTALIGATCLQIAVAGLPLRGPLRIMRLIKLAPGPMRVVSSWEHTPPQSFHRSGPTSTMALLQSRALRSLLPL